MSARCVILLAVLLLAFPWPCQSSTLVCFENNEEKQKCAIHGYVACKSWQYIVVASYDHEETESCSVQTTSVDDILEDAPYVMLQDTELTVYHKAGVCHTDGMSGSSEKIMFWCQNRIPRRAACGDLDHYTVPKEFTCPPVKGGDGAAHGALWGALGAAAVVGIIVAVLYRRRK